MWKLTFFFIPAAAAIFLRHLSQVLRQVMSKTFSPSLQPFLSGSHFNADWFNGIVTCFPVFCMDWIETTNPSLTRFIFRHVSAETSLYRNPVKQQNRNARFVVSLVVEASISARSSSFVRYSLSACCLAIRSCLPKA